MALGVGLGRVIRRGFWGSVALAGWEVWLGVSRGAGYEVMAYEFSFLICTVGGCVRRGRQGRGWCIYRLWTLSQDFMDGAVV